MIIETDDPGEILEDTLRHRDTVMPDFEEWAENIVRAITQRGRSASDLIAENLKGAFKQGYYVGKRDATASPYEHE